LARLAPEQRPQVVHQAGRTLAVAQERYATAGVKAHVRAFIDDMPGAYAWADLVICRAGASTVAELAASGCAAILVPFPHAVDDHQTRNGEYLARNGAAILMQERSLSPETLAAAITRLLADRAKLCQMAEAARRCAWPHAAEAIADICVEAAACRA
jgi:UDP-N-acetylglucosamine--N-acetylmuramyl-(pentapeptide) pyrophosphoryl-undecaprenol N-acetylglucosamine transferase